MLIAILLPALDKAREAGKIAVCKSNMRTLVAGSTIYAYDNDDVLPAGTLYNFPFANSETDLDFIGVVLKDYTSLPVTYYCPASTILPSASGDFYIAGGHYNIGYYYLGSYPNEAFDVTWDVGMSYPKNMSEVYSDSKLFQDRVSSTSRNHDGPNVGFGDGSVRSVYAEDLIPRPRSASFLPLW